MRASEAEAVSAGLASPPNLVDPRLLIDTSANSSYPSLREIGTYPFFPEQAPGGHSRRHLDRCLSTSDRVEVTRTLSARTARRGETTRAPRTYLGA